MSSLYQGKRLDVLPVGTAFQTRRGRENPRFEGSNIRVPLGTLRDRPQDVLSPTTLAKRHAGYRNRVAHAPSWRSDVWTELQRSQGASASDLARRVDCAFATVWTAKCDFDLLRDL